MATETLIIPISGAGNCGRSSLSTAAPHFYFLSERLKRLEGAKVVTPLVPAGLGVFGSLEKTYDRIAEAVEKTQRKHPPARCIVVGHSLGGLMARRLMADGLANSVLTIASPHRGLRRIIPAATRAAYQEFSEATPNTAAVGRLALIGCRFDELVPLTSSLAELTNAERHESTGASTHNALLLSRSVINLSAKIVSAMVAYPTREAPGASLPPEVASA